MLGVLCAFFCRSKYFERKQDADRKEKRGRARDKHDGALIGLSQLDIEMSGKFCLECCYVIIVLICAMYKRRMTRVQNSNDEFYP